MEKNDTKDEDFDVDFFLQVPLLLYLRTFNERAVFISI